MATLRSRIDEVLSAGLARMRLAPTGMLSDKREATSDEEDWEQVAREQYDADTRKHRDLRALAYMNSLSDSEHRRQDKQLRREVRAMPKVSEEVEERLRKEYAASHYSLEELMDAYSHGGGDDNDEYPEFTEEDYFREFVDNSSSSDRRQRDDEFPTVDESAADNNKARDKIKRDMLNEWVDRNPDARTLTRTDPLVKYLMEELGMGWADPLSWAQISKTFRDIKTHRRLGRRDVKVRVRGKNAQ